MCKVIPILLGWVVLIICVAYIVFVPPSFWMTVEKFSIDDANVGQSPHIAMNVVVNRPVDLDWFSTLYRKTDDTNWTVICGGSGTEIKNPDYIFPDNVTLTSLFNNSCVDNLKPGEYYVDINWNWTSLVNRGFNSDSTIFEISAAPSTIGRGIVYYNQTKPLPVIRHKIYSRKHRNMSPFLKWVPFFR